jgi:cysteine-rich repeat protein
LIIYFDLVERSVTPTSLPVSSAVAFDSTVGNFSAKNATIVSVSASASQSLGDCTSDEIGVRVIFQKIARNNPAVLVWGGRLSKPGDAVPSGFGSGTIGNNDAASDIDFLGFGNIYAIARGQGLGSKFSTVVNVSQTPGINLTKTVTSATGTCGVDDTDSISVAAGTQVKFCFKIDNTGSTSLLNVTLFDETLNVDLTSSLTGLTDRDSDSANDDLRNGRSARAEYLTIIDADITNTARATGSLAQVVDTSSANAYICGDSEVNAPTEMCDDGGNSDGDGCNASCQLESCGDGIDNNGTNEECDDSNQDDGDGCSAQCLLEVCQNNRVDFGEECDDGNDTSGDGCSRTCRTEVCANGFTDPQEQCDDGDILDGDGCDSMCRTEVCGNGVLQSGEECDDGNTSNEDDCSENCQEIICGNSRIDPTEACDDGNAESLDGCSNLCVTEYCGDSILNNGEAEECDGESGITEGQSCDEGCRVVECGNGDLETGEECDDDNLDDGDGCNSSCAIEYCGDGFDNNGDKESCDDENTVSGDGCSETCQIEYCGDGLVNNNGLVLKRVIFCEEETRCAPDTVNETCDDGNTEDGDGCDLNCKIENCGDGVLNTNEGCDDSNIDAGDGCSPACQEEVCGNGTVDFGEQCDDANKEIGDGCNACVSEFCGDGVVNNLTEVCDDSNTENGDGCNSSCQSEACGNNVLDAGEECDDGNLEVDDGCSASCVVELLDCNNQINGKAKVDRCGVCNGDGNSCLECTETSQVDKQIGLDGGARRQQEMVGSALLLASNAYKSIGKKLNKKFINQTAAQASQYHLEAWKVVWEMPSTVLACGSSFCVTVSQADKIESYRQNLGDLAALTKSVLAKIRKIHPQKFRQSKLKMLRSLAGLYAGNLAVLDAIAPTTDSCI